MKHNAGAVSVLFTGNGAAGGTDQGSIAHDVVSPGSLMIFPETWTGTSFNPINVAGATSEQYGAFSVTTSIEISEQVAVPEPAMPAVLGLGMLMLARLRRRR